MRSDRAVVAMLSIGFIVLGAELVIVALQLVKIAELIRLTHP